MTRKATYYRGFLLNLVGTVGFEPMDGTLVDTDLMIVLSYVDMYRKFRPGYKVSVTKLLSFSGPPLASVLPVEFPDVPYAEALAYFRKVCRHYYDETVYAYPGVKEVLIEL